ncbi:alpha/beta hydrolase [Mycolicibacterium boenickei]
MTNTPRGQLVHSARTASADGTSIQSYISGTGTPVVLVHGGIGDHLRWTPLRSRLSDSFTVVAYDRRGRGLSCDSGRSYSLDRECDDLRAVLIQCDQPAVVVAHSYGALVVLQAPDTLPNVKGALLYEPPFATSAYPVFDENLLEHWHGLLSSNRHAQMLESFYREAVGLDDDAIEATRRQPTWTARVVSAHLLLREAEVARSFRPHPRRAVFPTRFLCGDQTAAYLKASTHAAHASVAGSGLFILSGCGHNAIDTDPDVIAHEVHQLSSLSTA